MLVRISPILSFPACCRFFARISFRFKDGFSEKIFFTGWSLNFNLFVWPVIGVFGVNPGLFFSSSDLRGGPDVSRWSAEKIKFSGALISDSAHEFEPENFIFLSTTLTRPFEYNGRLDRKKKNKWAWRMDSALKRRLRIRIILFPSFFFFRAIPAFLIGRGKSCGRTSAFVSR